MRRVTDLGRELERLNLDLLLFPWRSDLNGMLDVDGNGTVLALDLSRPSGEVGVVPVGQ